MANRLIPALLALALAGPAFSQTEPPPDTPPLAVAADAASDEKVVVVPGQRPGPGLWKISRGDHVLWLFGTYGPLPKNMVWRSHQVEAVLAQSQEVIAPPSASPKIGVFKALSLLPHAFGMMNNPDGATLKETLPADVYARWEAMRKEYLGGKDFERERPLFVAERLYGAGLARAGLTTKNEVSNAVSAMVKASKVKVTDVHVQFPVEDPAEVMKMFKRSPMDDAACLSKTMDRLESDIAGMKERANAWSKGDLTEIRKLNFADREGACRDAMMRSPAVRKALKVDEIDAELKLAWLAAAEKALAANASTFAVVSIKEILNPSGVVAALQAKGYQVESPD